MGTFWNAAPPEWFHIFQHRPPNLYLFIQPITPLYLSPGEHACYSLLPGAQCLILLLLPYSSSHSASSELDTHMSPTNWLQTLQ